MRSNLATLDLMDSVDRARHAHRRPASVRRARRGGSHHHLQEMVLEKDPNASLAAALDQVAAGKIVALQSKQTRAQLETALLEQLIVEQTFEREGEAALEQHDRDSDAGRRKTREDPLRWSTNATEALTNWHLR